LSGSGPDAAARSFRINGDIDLFVYPTRKFKTTLTNILFHRPLDDGTSAAALVPYVLRRGTRRHPDLAAISRHLENLFGAGLDVDVLRFGERQILSFRLDVVDDRYLLMGGRDLLRAGLRLLRDILTDPVLDEERFPDDVVAQERLNLRRFVDRMVDDKARYALERCVSHMCRGEPYARFEYGDAAMIDALTPQEVTESWRRVLAESPMEVYVVGSTRPEAVRDAVAEHFGSIRSDGARNGLPAVVRRFPERVRQVRETSDLVQARLVLGFRTEIGYGHPLAVPLTVMNAIFGGSPVSRLFRTVREERSLAYYCSSTVDHAKGIMFVQAGIDAAHADEVESLVLAALDELRAARIDLEELRTAKQQLRAGLRAMTDSPARIAGFLQESRATGGRISFQRIMGRISRVRRIDVARAAGSMVLDTVYLLAGENG